MRKKLNVLLLETSPAEEHGDRNKMWRALPPDSPARSRPFHALPTEAVAAALATTTASGLSDDEAGRRRRQFGENVAAAAERTPWWRTLFAQLSQTVVLLLLIAAAAAAWLGEWIDATAILIIVVANAVLGVLQHFKAEKALAELANLAPPEAVVLREGRRRKVPAKELVPGDVVELTAGDIIPADVRLCDTASFRTQEAVLTGESEPVDKLDAELLADVAPPSERSNCAFAATTVTAGHATGIVIATGQNTELGRIGKLLSGVTRGETPLERRLQQLGRKLVGICVTLVVLIGALYWWRGAAGVEVLRLSIGLAVAAVPEGLPAVVTIALALGVQRMSRRKALVKNLAGVETLGSVNVICTDKTGTLTKNEMTVVELRVGGGIWKTTGVGYRPNGNVVRADETAAIEDAVTLRRRERDLELALRAGVLCNHGRLEVPDSAEGEAVVAVGDPTEISLLTVAAKRGLTRENLDAATVAEIPFDSQRKAMSVLCEHGDGRRVTYVKGALEYVLDRCVRYHDLGIERKLDVPARQAVVDIAAGMASRGLRVLALAWRSESRPTATIEERDLTLIGLLGIIDPPREEARRAVEACRNAGIRTIMITGDHRLTAEAVGRALGICDDRCRIVDGPEIELMDDRELATSVRTATVFARVTPDHKLRLVRALRNSGAVTAMTGDGVNDAPAVKEADVGVAMAVTGSQVTQEAATIVLLDDNFATIVAAVEEGRTIYANIRRFVLYLLAGNANKLLLMFSAFLLGLQEPLLALQILWLNLVTDGLPALALGVEPAEGSVMAQPPRRPEAPIVGLGDLTRLLVPAALMTACGLVAFQTMSAAGNSLPEARTATFCVVGFSQLAFAWTCRSRRRPGPSTSAPGHLGTALAASALLQLAAVTIPGFRGWFGVSDMPSGETWALVGVLSLLPAIAWEIVLRVPVVGRHCGVSR
ncbi:MAG: cation-translocating P-type ATPase [Planctomycetes bacterium]|nr:cation-translocating P-type ATPase [Planctomycetota bacterium]